MLQMCSASMLNTLKGKKSPYLIIYPTLLLVLLRNQWEQVCLCEKHLKNRLPGHSPFKTPGQGAIMNIYSMQNIHGTEVLSAKCTSISQVYWCKMAIILPVLLSFCINIADDMT